MPLVFRRFAESDWWGWAGATDPAYLAETAEAVFIVCANDAPGGGFALEVDTAFGAIYGTRTETETLARYLANCAADALAEFSAAGVTESEAVTYLESRLGLTFYGSL